jgi:hypothetical protein
LSVAAKTNPSFSSEEREWVADSLLILLGFPFPSTLAASQDADSQPTDGEQTLACCSPFQSPEFSPDPLARSCGFARVKVSAKADGGERSHQKNLLTVALYQEKSWEELPPKGFCFKRRFFERWERVMALESHSDKKTAVTGS